MSPFSVSEIAKTIEAQIANPEFASALLSSLKITGISTLNEATSSDVAFFFSKTYLDDFSKTRAGLIITGLDFVKPIESAGVPAWKNSILLACEDPYRAMGLVTQLFSKSLSAHDHQEWKSHPPKVHPTAILSSDVRLGHGVEIGPNVVIESGCEIAEGVRIYPHCYVGPRCFIGSGSVLFPNVTLYEKTRIGSRVRIHSGAVIGADGFGYAQVKDPVTRRPVDHQKIYHLGSVEIGDDVEIGANSSIDRGTLGATRIHSKVKIDNLVQIGHNCEVGEGSILCGTAGMAGSSSLGKFVIVTANSGTGNQVHVGDYSFLSAFTGVDKDVGPDSHLAGIPARPIKDQFKIMAILNRMLRDREKEKKGRES